MWSNSAAVIEHVKNSFAATEAGTSTLDAEVLGMRGSTGRKTRMFYNNLGNTQEAINVIDIGTKLGSSTASFLKNNGNVSVCVVDDWSQGGSSEELINTLKSSKLTLVVSKPDEADLALLPKANVVLYDSFYFDGELERSLKKLSAVFADVCVLIVDDWNAIGVNNQTYNALSAIDYTVVYENGVKTNYDSEAATTYWNGMGVFVLVKNGVKADAPVPVVEPVAAPVPVAEPVAAPVEPVAEVVAAPVEPVVEPVAEVVAAPVEPVAEVVAEPVAAAETPA